MPWIYLPGANSGSAAEGDCSRNRNKLLTTDGHMGLGTRRTNFHSAPTPQVPWVHPATITSSGPVWARSAGPRMAVQPNLHFAPEIFCDENNEESSYKRSDIDNGAAALYKATELIADMYKGLQLSENLKVPVGEQRYIDCRHGGNAKASPPRLSHQHAVVITKRISKDPWNPESQVATKVLPCKDHTQRAIKPAKWIPSGTEFLEKQQRAEKLARLAKEAKEASTKRASVGMISNKRESVCCKCGGGSQPIQRKFKKKKSKNKDKNKGLMKTSVTPVVDEVHQLSEQYQPNRVSAGDEEGGAKPKPLVSFPPLPDIQGVRVRLLSSFPEPHVQTETERRSAAHYGLWGDGKGQSSIEGRGEVPRADDVRSASHIEDSSRQVLQQGKAYIVPDHHLPSSNTPVSHEEDEGQASKLIIVPSRLSQLPVVEVQSSNGQGSGEHSETFAGQLPAAVQGPAEGPGVNGQPPFINSPFGYSSATSFSFAPSTASTPTTAVTPHSTATLDPENRTALKEPPISAATAGRGLPRFFPSFLVDEPLLLSAEVGSNPSLSTSTCPSSGEAGSFSYALSCSSDSVAELWELERLVDEQHQQLIARGLLPLADAGGGERTQRPSMSPQMDSTAGMATPGSMTSSGGSSDVSWEEGLRKLGLLPPT